MRAAIIENLARHDGSSDHLLAVQIAVCCIANIKRDRPLRYQSSVRVFGSAEFHVRERRIELTPDFNMFPPRKHLPIRNDGRLKIKVGQGQGIEPEASADKTAGPGYRCSPRSP